MATKPASRQPARAIGRVKHPSAFGQRLYGAISAKGLTANVFARSVDVSAGFLSGVYSGNKKPPLDRIEGWADTLSLRGRERKAFIMVAHLAQASQTVRDLFRQCSKLASIAKEAGIGQGQVDLDLLMAIDG